MATPTVAEAFGSVLMGCISEAANDHQRIADALHRIAASVPTAIGTTHGVARRPVTATDLAAEIARQIHRDLPSLAPIVTAAADYDRHVPAEES